MYSAKFVDEERVHSLEPFTVRRRRSVGPRRQVNDFTCTDVYRRPHWPHVLSQVFMEYWPTCSAMPGGKMQSSIATLLRLKMGYIDSACPIFQCRSHA